MENITIHNCEISIIDKLSNKLICEIINNRYLKYEINTHGH